MRKHYVIAALVAALAGAAVATPAQASVPVVSDCVSGWYVNDDETDLTPTQTEAGLLFDGKSIVHRAITPIPLSQVGPGTFTVAGDVTGVPPLFKMETTASYSTINVTGSGLFWSSKIPAADPGGQSNPVEHAAELIGKWSGYTADTKVATIGVGYASDPGNKATVSSVKFAGETYDLTCPKPQPSTSASASPSPSASETVSPQPSNSAPQPRNSSSGAAVAGGSEPGLPVTGSPVAKVAGAGAGLLLLGVGAVWFLRRRATRWQA